MKKKRIGLLGAAAIAMASLAGTAVQANVNVPVEQAQQKQNKEAIPAESKVIRPTYERNKLGGMSGERNPFKHYRVAGRNQRQLRKHLRANPHQRAKYCK